MTHTTPDNVCPRCGKRNPAEIHTCTPPDALPRAQSGWKLVPIEPTEDMVIAGFESAPDRIFDGEDYPIEFDSMSGCQQAAFKAKRCYAAMLSVAPLPPYAPSGWISAKHEAMQHTEPVACPVCNEGVLLESAYCNQCGIETVLDKQMSRNIDAMRLHAAGFDSLTDLIAAYEAAKQDAAHVPYSVALKALEWLRGNAATTIEDHSGDTYTLNEQVMPQNVAIAWAREIHRIDAKAYLDEAIADAAPSPGATK